MDHKKKLEIIRSCFEKFLQYRKILREKANDYVSDHSVTPQEGQNKIKTRNAYNKLLEKF